MELALAGLTIRRKEKPKPVNPVTEPEQRLLAYFHHRSAPAVKERGEYSTWQKTISKKKQRQLWRSPNAVLAQRFGAETYFFCLDIDTDSPYHPEQDGGAAIAGIKESLETIGIDAVIPCQSSYSEGIHLYGFFPEPVRSFPLARALKGALSDAGFDIAPGVLEVFPNVKQWAKSGFTPPKGQYYGLPDYAALRLPCQPETGFFILDEWLEIIGEGPELFLQQIENTAPQQDMEVLEKAIAHYRDAEMLWSIVQAETEDFYGETKDIGPDSINVSTSTIGGDVLDVLGRDCLDNAYLDEKPSLAAMKSHYEALKRRGWQSEDETQAIIKHLCRLTRIFVQTDGAEELAEKVRAIAVGMDGFQKYSDHVGDISRVCRDWARSTVTAGYYWCGHRKRTLPAPGEAVTGENPINEQRHLKAIDRFRRGLKGFIKHGFRFATKTALITALLKQVRGSKSTIQKHWRSLVDLAEKLINPDLAESSQSTGSKESTHPPDSKYTHSVFGAKSSALEVELCPLDDDWKPPPKPKPVTATAFLELTRTLPALTEQPDYESIETYMTQVFQLLQGTAYSSTFDGMVAIAGEIRRLKPAAMVQIRDWLKTLPVVPEAEQPKPVSPTADEIKESRRLRRKAGYKRFKAKANFGGAYA